MNPEILVYKSEKHTICRKCGERYGIEDSFLRGFGELMDRETQEFYKENINGFRDRQLKIRVCPECRFKNPACGPNHSHPHPCIICLLADKKCTICALFCGTGNKGSEYKIPMKKPIKSEIPDLQTQ